MRLPRLVTGTLCALSACCALAQVAPDAAASPEVRILRVRSSQADPEVKAFDDASLVVTERGATGAAPLAIFLPGTGGRPGNTEGLLRVVAGQGYRVIGLHYDDEPAVVQVCARRPDPACSELFRQERVFGTSGGAGGVDPPVRNPVAESIVRRLVMLLRHLDREHPGERWADYLAGDEPAWPKIVVSGLSQGAGMAAYIAKHRPVARVVLFSSPWDFHGPEQAPAPWLAQDSQTPPERWYAELHRRENTAALIANAYRELRIPPEHILVFDLDLPGRGNGANPFHPSTVRLAGYAEQWRWLYGRAGP